MIIGTYINTVGTTVPVAIPTCSNTFQSIFLRHEHILVEHGSRDVGLQLRLIISDRSCGAGAKVVEIVVNLPLSIFQPQSVGNLSVSRKLFHCVACTVFSGV